MKITQNDLNKIYLQESLMTKKPHYNSNKFNINEKEYGFKKEHFYPNNKFSEKSNQCFDIFIFRA